MNNETYGRAGVGADSKRSARGWVAPRWRRAGKSMGPTPTALGVLRERAYSALGNVERGNAAELA